MVVQVASWICSCGEDVEVFYIKQVYFDILVTFTFGGI